MRNLLTRAVFDKTFKAGEKFAEPDLETIDASFLYADGDGLHFMDQETFETLTLRPDMLGEDAKLLVDNLIVQVQKFNGNPIGVQFPPHVELKVTATEPGARGNTASGSVTKLATLETGLQIQVPLFIKEGEKVRVHTETREFSGTRVDGVRAPILSKAQEVLDARQQGLHGVWRVDRQRVFISIAVEMRRRASVAAVTRSSIVGLASTRRRKPSASISSSSQSVVRHHRCAAGLAGQQRHLSEDIARVEVRDAPFGACQSTETSPRRITNNDPPSSPCRTTTSPAPYTTTLGRLQKLRALLVRQQRKTSAPRTAALDRRGSPAAQDRFRRRHLHLDRVRNRDAVAPERVVDERCARDPSRAHRPRNR